MKADEYNELFRALVAAPLTAKQLGASIFLESSGGQLAIIRCGGRVAISPGEQATYAMGFRHTFLRNLEGELPTKPSTNISDYPFKVDPHDESEPESRRYRPMNLGNVPRFTIRFSSPEQGVRASLDDLRHRIETRVIQWTSWLTPERALAQIREFGENAYCERLWIEDYEAELQP